MVKLDQNNILIKVIFWGIVIVIVIYLFLIVEPRHNACWTKVPGYCTDKFNVAHKPGDSNADLLQRLEGFTELNFEKVFWRRSILNATVAAFILLAIYNRGIPPISQMVPITLIFFLLFYFQNSYYKMHFEMRSNFFAQQTINELRYRLGIAQKPNSDDWKGFW